jgi:hypothetical protein
LVQFLGGNFTEEKKQGLEICREIVANDQHKLELAKPVKIQDNYYKFLIGTFTFAPIGYLPNSNPDNETPTDSTQIIQDLQEQTE